MSSQQSDEDDCPDYPHMHLTDGRILHEDEVLAALAAYERVPIEEAETKARVQRLLHRDMEDEELELLRDLLGTIAEAQEPRMVAAFWHGCFQSARAARDERKGPNELMGGL